jgi:hypothetical protein
MNFSCWAAGGSGIPNAAGFPAQRVFALLSMFCGGARLNWPRFTDNVWNPFGVM